MYSWLTARIYVKDITENSDEKNQNSSMVAKGRLTPVSNNTNSRKINWKIGKEIKKEKEEEVQKSSYSKTQKI